MKILIALTYYRPYTSGLTVYAVRQARTLAALGHDVTVLTSRYERRLPGFEFMEGVKVVRLPVALRLSKGVIMPTLPLKAWRLIGNADIVNFHVPQMDAAILSIIARMRRKPIVLTYHCDLTMPAGWISQLAGWAANLANCISAGLADVIVHNTRDYAENSPFLQRYLDKLTVIQPPITGVPVTQADVAAFQQKYGIEPGQRIIGMVARLAAEKGVEYLAHAMPIVLESQPDARVIFVGEYQGVVGEQAYREKILPMIEGLGEHWEFLGVVSEREKSAFYHTCEVLVVPSINSTESFGMVQVEALTCGTPVVASDLPGVRQPVVRTGLGKIFPVGDAPALAEAILQVLKSGVGVEAEDAQAISAYYSTQTVAKAYEALFREVIGEHGQPTPG